VFANPADQGAAVLQATSEGRRLDGLRVLLAEDNEINQQIACELLEGVGAEVTVVSNGRDAVTRLKESGTPLPFDVVLMDLQMPVMGGHEATALIRAEARFAALPVIAMTAHATLEERQRCLAAGMNDHIAKPIDPGLLFETLARYHRATRPASEPTRNAAPPLSAVTMPLIEGLDTKDGLARVAGNEQLYLKLLRTFRDGQAAMDGRITAALEQGDPATAERLAHTLKGVAGNLGAKPVQAAAGTVEKLIRDNAPAPEIRTAVAALAAVLAPLIAQLPATPTETPAVAAPVADPALTHAILAQLAKMLEGFDAGAAEFIEQNTAILKPVFAPADWTQFTRHAQNYAFTDALELLKSAAGRAPA
jgi:two-component system, sensor histidine kinase and response regulator